MRKYEFELNRSARTIVERALELQAGETLVITADTTSDATVAEALAQACLSVGAHPLVMWMRTPRGVAMAADRDLPGDAIVGALREADAWIELNVQYLNYSQIFRSALELNPKLRFYCLPGVTVDVMVRCFSELDLPLLALNSHQSSSSSG